MGMGNKVADEMATGLNPGSINDSIKGSVEDLKKPIHMDMNKIGAMNGGKLNKIEPGDDDAKLMVPS